MAPNELKNFLDQQGQLTRWPAKSKIQMLALKYLAKQLEWDRQYTEPEVNELLTKFHTFKDAALLRRELYMKHFLDRKSDGSAYWKTRRVLPPSWSTKRAEVRDAKESDILALQSIYEACGYIKEWIGKPDDEESVMHKEVCGKSLPPNGKRELQRAQAILEKTSDEIIGYIAVYHGYPNADTFWIALFGIDPKAQRKGLGREVIQALESEVRELGSFTHMGLGIGVGNDPAMKFWSSCGFTNAVKLEDHGTHKDEWRVKDLRD